MRHTAKHSSTIQGYDCDLISATGMAMALDGTPTDEDWRSLAARIQAETDPDKLIELVKQLIARFDEQSSRQRRPPDSDVR